MGAFAAGAQQDPQGALAAALDLLVGGFEEDREIGLQPARVGRGEVLEPVALGGDLLVVVEHEGEVAVGLGDGAGDPQLHGDTGLHVAGAAAPQDAVLVEAGGDVVRDGHGVDVPGEHDALRAAEFRARDDVVAVAVDRQVRERAQGRLDRVREGLLRAALGRDVHEPGGELGGVLVEVEVQDGRGALLGRRGCGGCGAVHGSDPNTPNRGTNKGDPGIPLRPGGRRPGKPPSAAPRFAGWLQ